MKPLDQIDPELITCKAVQSLSTDAEPYISLKKLEKIAKNLNANDFTIVASTSLVVHALPYMNQRCTESPFLDSSSSSCFDQPDS